MENEIRKSIKTVFGELWEILALYEKTDCYNIVPDKESKSDIWNYMDERFLHVRKTVNVLFLGESELRKKLMQIVDETEYFVRRYEKPGVIKRWKEINPRLLFFDVSFEILDESPELYKKMCRGLTDINLSCYPDIDLIYAKKVYFKQIKQANEDNNLRYSEEKIFQNELLQTLTLVFENDFKEYLV